MIYQCNIPTLSIASKELSYVILYSVTSVFKGRVITGRNEVVAKVMFLQMSVIHSVHRGRGGLRRTPPHQGEPPWTRENPPRTRETPRTREKPPRTRENPPDQADPPRPGRPPQEEDCSIRSMSCRYASYWNAFLLPIRSSCWDQRFRVMRLRRLSSL